MKYTFRCLKCSERIEVEHRVDEPHPINHSCGGRLIRTFEPVGIVFSGPGFYTTDKREPPHEINLPPIPADEME